MAAPVVLLSLDTIRQDVFCERCFPQSWEILTSDFARFPNALSHGVATPHAFPGIIAGEPVVGDGQIPDSATTLAELFDGHTVGFSNNGHLRADRGYDRGFDQFDDSNPPTHRTEIESPSFVERLKQVEAVRNSTLVRKMYERYKSLVESDDDTPYSKPSTRADVVTEWVLTELSEGGTTVVPLGALHGCPQAVHPGVCR